MATIVKTPQFGFFVIMKNLLFVCLLVLPVIVGAQDFEYRSGENPYYWKNRKPFEGYWQQDVHYRIHAELNDATDIVSGQEVLTYYNNSPDTLNLLYFHLYQNAFIKGGYLENLNLANDFKQRFGKYEQAGLGTEVLSVRVGNTELPKWIDFSIMRVNLLEHLLPGSSVQVTIEFKTYFDNGGNQRRRMKMFEDGFGNKQYDGVHWYPRICVYDRKFGWETDQHLGKEFYGDYGQYEVRLTVPSHYIVEATGELQNQSEVLPEALRQRIDLKNFANKPWNEKPSEILPRDGRTKTWIFRSVNTHDFAWIADPTFRIGEVILKLPDNPRKEVRCLSVVQEQHASGWQDAAPFLAKIIELYSRDIGTFAYPKMIVADARDGMEYPMLTLDGGRSPGYYGLFAHEVGHNWFFGMVGNNETYRASLDEGFTQFLTHWCMSRLTREPAPARNPKNWVSKYYRPMPGMDQTVYMGYLRDAINGMDVSINKHSDDFSGALHHGGGYGHVYYKTATMLYNLQYVLGDELFLSAMQHYFNQWKMAHPYIEDFRNSIIQFTHVDLNWFFDQWLETKKVTDYRVSNVKRHNTDSLAITFQRLGGMQMPLDFRVIGKDSGISDFLIPNTYFSKKTHATVLPYWRGWGKLNHYYTAYVPFRGQVANVVIDPSYRLADVNQLNNSWKTPVLFSFDHQINNPPDRRNYILKWRPDLWYNAYDGIKPGLHLNGNYLNQNHAFRLGIWYNTALANNRDNLLYTDEPDIRILNYAIQYKHRFFGGFDVNYNIRYLDGLKLGRIGFEVNHYPHFSARFYQKTFIRDRLYYLPGYGLTSGSGSAFLPDISSLNKLNSYFGLDLDLNFGPGTWGSTKIALSTKISLPNSDFVYDYQQIQILHKIALWRFDFKTRIFGASIRGSQIPAESQIYLAGSNPEDMAESKFYRSTGILPADQFTYGSLPNHIQAGGGLNLRGYAGYLVPVNANSTQYYLYRGSHGFAANMEVDYGRLLPSISGKLSRYFHLAPYLFADAGIMGTQSSAHPDHTWKLPEDMVSTALMADAGLGFAFTIKRWGFLDEPKPLTLRLDLPVFLSTAPFAEPDYLKLRWVFGIGRCF